MSTTRKITAASSASRLALLPLSRDELLGASQIVHHLKGCGEPNLANDESLIIDDRSAVSPAQMVENKLSRMLKDASMPVSHLQMRGLLRSR